MTIAKRVYSWVMFVVLFAAVCGLVADVAGILRGHMPSRVDLCLVFGIAICAGCVWTLEYLADACGMKL